MNGAFQQRMPSGERGSALLAAMCFTIVLALALASYQAVCYYTLKMGSRSVQTSRSRELAEAGLEEALWALNQGATYDWSSSGWTIANGIATKTIHSGFSFEGHTAGTITLTVSNYDGAHTATDPRTISAKGGVVTADGTAFSRTLTASIQAGAKAYAPLLANAIAATGANSGGGIANLTSGGLIVDSYDSSAGTYNATLADGTKNAGYSAIVVGANSVTLANGTQVKGYVATSSSDTGAVALTVGNTATLTSPTTASGVKIDSTRESTSPYQNNFDVPTPSGAGASLTEPSGTVHLGTAGGSVTTYYATLGGTSGWAGWYYLALGTLQIDGPVILVVPGSLYINGSGSIVIKSGGSLQILVSGSTYVYYNGIDNQTMLPKNLAIIGTGTYTGNVVQIWTSTKFYGSVYAPKADITLYGASGTSEFFGSVVGNNVTVYPYNSTALPIHYDVDLRNTVLSGVTAANPPVAVSTITESP